MFVLIDSWSHGKMGSGTYLHVTHQLCQEFWVLGSLFQAFHAHLDVLERVLLGKAETGKGGKSEDEELLKHDVNLFFVERQQKGGTERLACCCCCCRTMN